MCVVYELITFGIFFHALEKVPLRGSVEMESRLIEQDNRIFERPPSFVEERHVKREEPLETLRAFV